MSRIDLFWEKINITTAMIIYKWFYMNLCQTHIANKNEMKVTRLLRLNTHRINTC